jgi:hypothetical protein
MYVKMAISRHCIRNPDKKKIQNVPLNRFSGVQGWGPSEKNSEKRPRIRNLKKKDAPIFGS